MSGVDTIQQAWSGVVAVAQQRCGVSAREYGCVGARQAAEAVFIHTHMICGGASQCECEWVYGQCGSEELVAVVCGMCGPYTV